LRWRWAGRSQRALQRYFEYRRAPQAKSSQQRACDAISQRCTKRNATSLVDTKAITNTGPLIHPATFCYAAAVDNATPLAIGGFNKSFPITNRNAVALCHANTNDPPFSVTDPDTHADAYADTHTHADAHADTHADTHTHTDANADTHTHSHRSLSHCHSRVRQLWWTRI
jgi:hypothetical protein